MKSQYWTCSSKPLRPRCIVVPRAAGAAQPGPISQVPADPVLGDVRVVLVAPKTAANIGAVARCAANFEVTQLWVVAPRCDAKSGDAYKVACGDAIMDRLVVVDDLQAALADTESSVGFTRRAVAARLTYASITDMLANFPSAIPNMTLTGVDQQSSLTAGAGAPPTGVTAIVFGREESGLTEAELRLCSHACAIPTGRIQGSMNLSHAASVVLYELYQRRQAYNALLEADAATQSTVLTGQLPASHPAAHTFAAVPWLLPLAVSGQRHMSHTTSDAAQVAAAEPHGSQEAAQQPGVYVPEGLQPATRAEWEALIEKAAAIARAVGLSGEESRGGNQGNHGRKRLPVGYIRALLSRARPLQGEVRSLHGLASKILAMVDPGHNIASSSQHGMRNAVCGPLAAMAAMKDEHEECLRETKAQLDSVLGWVVSALEHEEQSQLLHALHCYQKALVAVSMVQTVQLPILSSLEPSAGARRTTDDEASFQVLDQVLEGFSSTYKARIQSLETVLLAQGHSMPTDTALQAHHLDSCGSAGQAGGVTLPSSCNSSQLVTSWPQCAAADTRSWSYDTSPTVVISADGCLASGSSQVLQEQQMQPATPLAPPTAPPQQQALTESDQALLQQCSRSVSGTLDDLAGLPDIKQQLRQAVLLPMKMPHLFTGLRTPPRTFLMYGPPGTGKTIMVEKVAAEAGLHLLSLSPSCVLSRWSGDAEKTLRAAFHLAAACAPCALFLDEIDALAPSRGGGGGGGGGDDVSSRRLLTELLLQLNRVCASPAPGCVDTSQVYVFAATNRLQDCDVALLRRFHKRIHVPLPDELGRLAFFQGALHQPELAHDFGGPVEQQQTLDTLVQLTRGYSFSDLSVLVKEAAMTPVRELMDAVTPGRNTPGAPPLPPPPSQPQQQQVQLRKLVLQDFVAAVSKAQPAALEQQAAGDM